MLWGKLSAQILWWGHLFLKRFLIWCWLTQITCHYCTSPIVMPYMLNNYHLANIQYQFKWLINHWFINLIRLSLNVLGHHFYFMFFVIEKHFVYLPQTLYYYRRIELIILVYEWILCSTRLCFLTKLIR